MSPPVNLTPAVTSEAGATSILTQGEVYRFDKEAKEQSMTPDQRLQYHQEKSAGLMEELEAWLDGQIEQKLVEPNSSLGDAISRPGERLQ